MHIHCMNTHPSSMSYSWPWLCIQISQFVKTSMLYWLPTFSPESLQSIHQRLSSFPTCAHGLLNYQKVYHRTIMTSLPYTKILLGTPQRRNHPQPSDPGLTDTQYMCTKEKSQWKWVVSTEKQNTPWYFHRQIYKLSPSCLSLNNCFKQKGNRGMIIELGCCQTFGRSE